MAEHADDAAALLHALDLTPAVVVGHSSGAAVACELAARAELLDRRFSQVPWHVSHFN